MVNIHVRQTWVQSVLEIKDYKIKYLPMQSQPFLHKEKGHSSTLIFMLLFLSVHATNPNLWVISSKQKFIATYSKGKVFELWRKIATVLATYYQCCHGNSPIFRIRTEQL